MTNAAFSLDDLKERSVQLSLPADVASMLEKEAKSRRKSVAAVLRELLEDRADARDARKILKRVRDGKEKTIPATEVYHKLGL